MDKCREAFESKYRELHPDDKCTMMENGNYSGWIKQAHWWMWQSRQAEINQFQSQINEMAEVGLGQESALREKDKRIANQNDFIEMALNSLNHLKENAITHRDYGHECNWTRSFNDLIKLASDAEDSLNEALRGDDDINVTR